MQPLELVSPIFESVDPSTLPCVAAGPELFFSESPGELEAAKRLCRPCPLRSACLAGAIERAEPWGVWGGEVFQFGRPVPYKRPRGRPRKHPVPPVPVAIDASAEAKAS
jgi:WhiB family transcriptional regulator, redox-sensing transcriptional regulator